MPNTVGYRVPTMVAVTTALAAGGGLFLGVGIAPPGAVPIDQPVDVTPQSVAGGGQLLVTWPAMGAAEAGIVTTLGVDTADVANTRITTRVNGVAVPPYILHIGAIGTLQQPTPLPAPISLPALAVFSVLMENLSGVPVLMAARAQGWSIS